MGQHFQGKYEVELKFRLNESCSKQQLLERLNAMEHECMFADNQEDDCYFDTPDGQLAAADKSLCIREMQPSNNLLWILKIKWRLSSRSLHLFKSGGNFFSKDIILNDSKNRNP